MFDGLAQANDEFYVIFIEVGLSPIPLGESLITFALFLSAGYCMSKCRYCSVSMRMILVIVGQLPILFGYASYVDVFNVRCLLFDVDNLSFVVHGS